MTDAEMQQIAADVGYSESAFIIGRDGDRVRIRYFSPLAEVAFCGHATIATSIALAEREGPGTYIVRDPGRRRRHRGGRRATTASCWRL